ncbi:MAG: hypothetical protein Q4D61_09020 [Cardiobacteriaceae bacterium]|nr:hypothetical protein [Cardiobacteriaceae bacterium]
MPRFPDWHHSDELIAILDALPDQRLNRALHDLLWQYAGENSDAAQREALLALLQHPRYRGLQNLHHWIGDVLHGGTPWTTLLPHIEAQLGHLHHESCATFGDQAGMSDDTDALEAAVARLFAEGSDNAHSIIWSILYWHKALAVRRPAWDAWLRQRIAALHRE